MSIVQKSFCADFNRFFMIKNSLILLLCLFVGFCLFRIFSHSTETVDVTLSAKILVKHKDLDDFLKAVSSFGNRLGLSKSETISKNPKGLDVVTLQLKKGDEIVLVVLNSLLEDKFSAYFYGDKADAFVVYKEFEKEMAGRWVLIR